MPFPALRPTLKDHRSRGLPGPHRSLVALSVLCSSSSSGVCPPTLVRVASSSWKATRRRVADVLKVHQVRKLSSVLGYIVRDRVRETPSHRVARQFKGAPRAVSHTRGAV